MTAPNKLSQALANVVGDAPDYRFYYLSELLHRPVEIAEGGTLGRIRDVVVKLATPYPQVIGLLLEHGWGRPDEFVSWERVVVFSPGKITVRREDGDEPYRQYVDQPGRILLDEHLMGQVILDIDGRRTHVVNDVHLLESKRRMLLVHVDVADKPLFGRVGFRRKRQLVSWRTFHPLTVEDAASDTVMLTVTRKQSKYLPSDDLVEALEELKKQEQTSPQPRPEAAASRTALPVSRDHVAVSAETRVRDVLQQIRGAPRQPDDISDIFVIGTDGALEGAVSLAALVLAPDETPVRAVMSAAPAALTSTDDRTAAGEKFSRGVARTLPVLDENGRLVGIVRRSDVWR